MQLIQLKWEQVDEVVYDLAQLARTFNPRAIVGISRGGLPLATAMSYRLNRPLYAMDCSEDGLMLPIPPQLLQSCVIVDDAIESGRTVQRARTRLWRAVPALCWARWGDRIENSFAYRVAAQGEYYAFPWYEPGRAAMQHSRNMPSSQTLGPMPVEELPSCAACGVVMFKYGSCWRCINCGSTSACS